ncbi:MAG: reverse gyrase [Ignisphaera sp.]
MSIGSIEIRTRYSDTSHGTVLHVSVGDLPLDKFIERLKVPRGIYLRLCPNCGGPIEDSRLIFKNACSRCMGGDSILEIRDIVELSHYLKELNPDGTLKKIIDIRAFINGFREFFARCVGNNPWNLQISWIIRIVQNQSFALIAPTGVGKTTFGLIVALYLAYKYGKKSYIIVPTTVLVRLYEKKIREFMERAGIFVNVIAMYSRISQKKKVELENIIREGSFDILITTSKYLQKKFHDVFKEFLRREQKIDFVFVDDVDAIMKGSKAIDMVLMLIGFNERDIENGYRLISLRQRLVKCETVENNKDRGLCYENGKHVREIFEEIQHTILSKRKLCGVLVISSATSRARGRRIKLFRELLGFYIGSAVDIYRNVIDTYMPMPQEEGELVELLVKLISRLGDGGLIYVPMDKGLEYAYRLRDFIKNKGIEIEVLSSKQPNVLEKFIASKYKALIGVAMYYGLLVRGIDIPEKIRYAIFIGVPRHKISLTQVGFNPQNLLRLLIVLSDVIQDPGQRDNIVKLIVRLRRIIRGTSPERLIAIVEKIASGRVIEDPIASTIIEVKNIITSLLSSRDIIEALKKYPKTSIVEESGILYILIPDAPTYIQASGRTSRLFIGGVTTGLSIILVDDERLINGLIDRVRFFIEDFSLKPFNSINIDEILKRIDEDRELVKQIREGKILVDHVAKELRVRTVLFIVESPNKARTIASFFGRPAYREFEGLRVYETNVGEMHLIIASTGGHIFEVVEEELQEDNIYGIAVARADNKVLFLPKYDYIKRCFDCGTQFVKDDKCPLCGSLRYKSSKNIVESLQKLALEVDEVIIATDPDAEGEKIGYDIAIALAPFAKSIVRAEFHEVTRKAVLNALKNPRGINLLLVEAQITRRIEDRWLGFALSEYVTNKLRSMNLITRAREGRLSAGRVQTPVLGRIIEVYLNRARTVRKSKLLILDGLIIEVPQHLLEKALKEDIKRLSPSRVEVTFVPLIKRSEYLYPPPPLTTDEMIAEAQRLLKLEAVEVMSIAQELFELGFITYHRTDSTRISSTGISIAGEYLANVFGNNYLELFEPKTWGTGGAHEGIRPTRPIDAMKLKELIAEGVIEIPIRLTSNHYKLYDLIFRRFIASQMKPALAEKTRYVVIVKVDGREVVRQSIDVITKVLDPGYTLVYSSTKVVALPSAEFTVRPLKIVTAILSDYPLPTQGDIIKWMKEIGIGRPSTYAKVVDTIMKRGYVIGTRGGLLLPSLEGIYVYTLLAGLNFPEGIYSLEDTLVILKNVYKKNEQIIDNMKRIIDLTRDNISRMVSVKRTKELYERIQAIEESKANYMELVYELFKEVCMHIINELEKGLDICKKVQALL